VIFAVCVVVFRVTSFAHMTRIRDWCLCTVYDKSAMYSCGLCVAGCMLLLLEQCLFILKPTWLANFSKSCYIQNCNVHCTITTCLLFISTVLDISRSISSHST
jgi:hypothetical protein